MSDRRVRAQGVIYTTLVDFLLQIVFLLILILIPLMALLDKAADVEELNKIHPHVKVFLPKTESINWDELAMALVPKDLAKAYAAEPEKLGKDLKELMAAAGHDPKVADFGEIKRRLENYKVLEEKVAKYERGREKPRCSLALSGDPYVRESQPLLDIVLQAGGFRVRPNSELAATYWKARVGVELPPGFTFRSRAEYSSLMSRANQVDPSCSHTVRIVADETPADAKLEYRSLMQTIDMTAYKQQRF